MNHNKASLCKTRKEKLHSSKRMMCIIYCSHFGIISLNLYTNLLKASTFFLFKALFFSFFFGKTNILAFAQQNMHGYNFRNDFCSKMWWGFLAFLLMGKKKFIIYSLTFTTCKPLPTSIMEKKKTHKMAVLKLQFREQKQQKKEEKKVKHEHNSEY